jgi:NAD(P)-dependent dehydrogenase (short-subunit alcohol dehydrogenase family)
MRENGRVHGKVVFITGAAGGQGRSHAVVMAREGADVVAIDIERARRDLDETAELVKGAGGRCLPILADVADIHAMDRAVKEALDTFGRLDIVLANAGILPPHRGGETLDESAELWASVVAVNLTGVYNTIRVAVQPMIDQGEGGSIVITSSTAGISGMHDGSGGSAGYCATKHAVVGLMRGYAKLLGRHNIRVNSIHPMGVATAMIQSEEWRAAMKQRVVDPDEVSPMAPRRLPIDVLDPIDVTNAIMWLVSNDARAVTGITLPIDAGVATP